MGGQSSKPSTAKYGQIYLKTDQPYYMCGETVTGKIYINLIATYPGNELVLKILGQERVNWADKKPNLGNLNEQKDDDVDFDDFDLGSPRLLSQVPDGLVERHDKKTIIKFKVPVYRWHSDFIPPGQMVFPFSFVIPQNVPGSFYNIGNHFRAEISYSLLTTLTSSDTTMQSLKYKQEFFVKEHVLGEIKPISKDLTQHITHCFCLDKGRITVKVNVSKNALTPGETVLLHIEADTTYSKLPISRFFCTMKQNITMRALKFNEIKEKEVTLSTAILDGINSYSKISAENARAISFTVPMSNDGSKPSLVEEKKIFKNSATNTHKSLVTSCRGEAVQCSYYFEILPEVQGITCGKAPNSIIIPFQVYAPLLFFDEKNVIPPANWNPISMPTTNFSIGASFMNVNPYLTVHSMEDHPMRPSAHFPHEEINSSYANFATPEKFPHHEQSELYSFNHVPVYNRETFGVVGSMASGH